MTDPWKCPDCGIWLSPVVSSHRCEKPTEDKPAELEQPPATVANLSGSFERQNRYDYEPAPKWGFRP